MPRQHTASYGGWGKGKPARGEMKNKTVRKIQFGGWTKRSYKEVRYKIKKRVEQEEGVKLGNQVR